MKKRVLIQLLLVAISCAFAYFTRNIYIDNNAKWNLVRLICVAILAYIIFAIIAFATTNYKHLVPYIKKFRRYKPFLLQMVQRDFKVKYKRSVLGVLWTVLNPLLSMLVLTIVFSTIFRFDIPNYPVYLLSGQIAFGLFSDITNTSLMAILSGAPMIKKVSVPKYIFPLSKAISGLINMMFSLIALFLIMLITHAPIYWTMFLIPVAILYMFLFSLGIGFILSTFMVFFRDTAYLYGILLMAVTYLTPLFYPVSIIPDRFRPVISLNPMFHLIEYFRTVAIYATVPSVWQNVICLLISVSTFLLGTLIFYKNQDKFILYI